MNTNPFHWKYMPALLWSAFIFALCFIPGSTLPQEDWLDKICFDKIVHAVLYFILFLLLMRGAGKRMLMAAALCILQGVLIECLQDRLAFLQRSFDALDIVANAAGVLMSWFFVRRSNLF